jgi:hypothetical protein
VMLEGCAQRGGNAGVAGIGHKPVGLARALAQLALGAIGADQAASADRPEAPPYAPIRGRPSPAHAGALACRNLDRLRPEVIPGPCAAPAGTRQTGSLQIGSGWGSPVHPAAAATGLGWGMRRRKIASARGNDARQGAAHVN